MYKIEETKKSYESIEIPQTLNATVNSAIDRAMKKKRNPFIHTNPFVLVAACACIVLLISINSNQAFAESIYKIPVLGSIARVFTFREYQQENEGYSISLKEPALEGTNNTELEERINKEIQSRINNIKKNAEERAEENKQLLLQEGGSMEDLPYFTVIVDYEIKSSTNTSLSFVVNHTESYANTYTNQTFFNINLETGEDIAITELLGDDYQEIIKENLRKQIKERMKQNPEFMYYTTEDYESYIFDDLKFYINSLGNVVIAFGKGEIAPPPMGLQEFEIIK